MNEKHLNFKILLFYIAFALITLIFAIVFCIRIFKVTTFDDLSDIKRANLMINGPITTKKEDTYYVYIYSSKAHDTNYAYEEVEPTIFTYFTFVAKGNKNENIKIYAYDVDTFSETNQFKTVNDYLQSLNGSLKTSELPALVKVSNGAVSSAYTGINKIVGELQGVMAK